MKHLFLPAALLLGPLTAATALAQTAVTLAPATFPAAATTVEYYQDADAGRSSLAPTATGANRTWDYRSLVSGGGGAYTLANQSVPAGGIAGAQWARAEQTSLVGLTYAYVAYQALGPAGRLSLGRVVPRQVTYLGNVTGNGTDSAVVSRQTTLFGPAGVVDFPLPLTAGSYARRTLRFATQGTITVQAFGLTNAPFRIVQRYVFVDSVAGWGTLRLPAAGRPAGTGPVPVLLVRGLVLRQDSIYLNGSPAPPALLAGLGVAQGEVSVAYYDRFWRPNSAQPALEFAYPDDLYRTPTGARYSTETSLLPTRPAALPATSVAVWPNPATPGQPLHVEWNHAGQPLALAVRDAQGRLVLRRVAPAGQPLALPTGLPAGLYLLEAITATGRVTARVLVE